MSKYLSRKFILTVISAIGGIAISLSQFGGKIAVVCAIISAILPAVTYIITEGIIDAKAVQLTSNAVQDVVTIVKDKADYLNGDTYSTFSTSEVTADADKN